MRGLHEQLRDTRSLHDTRDATRDEVVRAAVGPIQESVGNLEQHASAMTAERRKLVESDPRKLLAEQQRLVQEAQEAARRDRQAREKLEAELREAQRKLDKVKADLERRRGEIAARTLEFGEKGRR